MQAYKNDATILSWNLINEPRCDAIGCNTDMLAWIQEMAPYLKSLDSNHLVTVGELAQCVKQQTCPTSSPSEPAGCEGRSAIEVHNQGQPLRTKRGTFECKATITCRTFGESYASAQGQPSMLILQQTAALRCQIVTVSSVGGCAGMDGFYDRRSCLAPTGNPSSWAGYTGQDFLPQHAVQVTSLPNVFPFVN